jgi:hypothetical protein
MCEKKSIHLLDGKSENWILGGICAGVGEMLSGYTNRDYI